MTTLKRVLTRIINLVANRRRYKTSELQRRRTSEANKGRIPWNKGKAGMGIYSEEALAKMLKGTLKGQAKRRRKGRIRRAIKKGIKELLKLKIRITNLIVKALIKAHRRYKKYRKDYRKRKLIEEREERKKWLHQKYTEEKLSMIQIAELNNVTRQAVSKELKKFGIVTRSIKEAWKECKARREERERASI